MATVLAAVNGRAKMGSGLLWSGPGGFGSSVTALITVVGVDDVADAFSVKLTGKFGIWPSGVRASVRGKSTTRLKCWTDLRSSCTHFDGVTSCVSDCRLM